MELGREIWWVKVLSRQKTLRLGSWTVSALRPGTAQPSPTKVIFNPKDVAFENKHP